VLFLADHPLTGGYPVIGSVATHHLPLAGQLPPGARIRFRVVDPRAPARSDPSLGASDPSLRASDVETTRPTATPREDDTASGRPHILGGFDPAV
jgi:hypothetical protein